MYFGCTYMLHSADKKVIKTHNLLKTSLGRISHWSRERETNEGGPASLKIKIQSPHLYV